jgi:Right handed beta helix region
VQPGGRLEAVDAVLADLGTGPSDPNGRPGVNDRAGVQFGSGSSGSLMRTSLLRNGTGLRLSGSQDVRLDDVTVSASAGDGLVLRDDRGTVMRGIRTERNGGYGVRVSGTGAGRPVTGITTAGNGKFGIVLVGATDTQVRGVATSGDAAGGIQISRSSDVTVSGLTATDEPMGVFTHLGSTNTVLDRLAIADGRRGVVIEKTTKHLVIQASTIDGARVAGVTIGGTGVELRDLTVSDSRTGVRVERGAEGVTAVGLTLFGGEDGVVATAGTTGVVLQDLTAEGVENESVRSFSPDTRILGGTIRGGSTGIHVGAGGTISGTSISLADEGIRAGSRSPVRADVVTVDAVSVGINTEAGSPFLLTDSSVHALEAVRGDLDQQGVNDLSLPPLNLLGAIGIPLVVLALILELAHTARQRGTGESVRRRTPPAPATRAAQDRVFSNRRDRIETNAAGSVSSPPSASSAIP